MCGVCLHLRYEAQQSTKYEQVTVNLVLSSLIVEERSNYRSIEIFALLPRSVPSRTGAECGRGTVRQVA